LTLVIVIADQYEFERLEQYHESYRDEFLPAMEHAVGIILSGILPTENVSPHGRDFIAAFPLHEPASRNAAFRLLNRFSSIRCSLKAAFQR